MDTPSTKDIVASRIARPALERELLAPLFHVAKKKFGQNIMLGGLKTLKNLGESISDTQITVSRSVWKRTQKTVIFGQKWLFLTFFYVFGSPFEQLEQ